MKNRYKLVAGLVGIWLITGCSNAPVAKNHVHQHDAVAGATDTAGVIANTTVIRDSRLNAVYQQYLVLTRALAAGDAREVMIAANALAAGAQTIGNGNAMVAPATGIAATPEISRQRELFARLSDVMIAQVKQMGVQHGALYIDFCPMALDDKGAYWLSADKEIRNPYFGAQMLTCGETKDTIR